MEKIEYIHIDLLQPHPDNPRKDVGDVTELAESIKANGILQNLTVVPYGDGELRVIIGHRRLAAAKMAGIEELPCVIVEMSEKDQISTMLTENMQRVDLSIYEQAQGFQMMLDMGDSMDDIAGKSGFSKTTVRKRLEIAKLDGNKLKKATEERQVTMADFDKLAEIEDIEIRNKLLTDIGTPNFKNAMTRELNDQKTKARILEWLEVVKTFATEISMDDIDREKMSYIRNYSWYSLSTEVQVPDDADTVKYYYLLTNKEIDIYKERDIAKEKADQSKRDERRRKQDEERAIWCDINDRHYDLRLEFVHQLSNATCKAFFAEISLFMAEVVQSMTADMYYSRQKMDIGIAAYCLDNPIAGGVQKIADVPGLQDAIGRLPEKAMLALAYSAMDSEASGYWNADWVAAVQDYEYNHKENERLDKVYKLLCTLGYEMSDEEKQMQDGTLSGFHTTGKDELTDDEEDEDYGE